MICCDAHQGTLARREVPFSAVLNQEYRDGQAGRQRVEGVLTFSALLNLTASLQPPRFTASDQMAPTTTTTTTTTTTSTTTTKSTATAPSSLLDYSKADSEDTSTVVERMFRSWSRPESDSHLAAPPALLLPATLFPPMEAVPTTPNPLRWFYPAEEEEAAGSRDEGGGVLAAQVSDQAAGGRMRCGGGPSSVLFVLLLVRYLSGLFVDV